MLNYQFRSGSKGYLSNLSPVAHHCGYVLDDVPEFTPLRWRGSGGPGPVKNYPQLRPPLAIDEQTRGSLLKVLAWATDDIQHLNRLVVYADRE